MNKELSDRVWKILPKEFREEVKYEYRRVATKATKDSYDLGFMHAHEGMFGHHNLTSDAEGEDEMLTVPRKKVQDFFMNFKREKNDAKSTFDKVSLGARMSMLHELFGSKCLPDEEQIAENANCSNVDSLPQNPTENCDNKSHISTDDSKPAEPTDFGREVNFPTKNNPTIYLKKSKNCDNRLQIAAMAMQGILSNIDLFKNVLETETETLSGDGISYRAVAKASLLFADALIAESEKRSGHGK